MMLVSEQAIAKSALRNAQGYFSSDEIALALPILATASLCLATAALILASAWDIASR